LSAFVMFVSVLQFIGGFADVRHVMQPATALHAARASQHELWVQVSHVLLGGGKTVEQSKVPASPASPASPPASGVPPSAGLHEGGGGGGMLTV
jgi:hypothetical protein